MKQKPILDPLKDYEEVKADLRQQLAEDTPALKPEGRGMQNHIRTPKEETDYQRGAVNAAYSQGQEQLQNVAPHFIDLSAVELPDPEINLSWFKIIGEWICWLALVGLLIWVWGLK